MVVAVVEMRIHTIAAAVHQGGHTLEVFGFQERLGWFLELGLYVLLYWALVDGLYWPTTMACSAIKSLTEGAVGQCSHW